MTNTRNRRASVSGLFGPMTFAFPNPDSDLDDVEDRQHMANVYSRELAAPAPIEGGKGGGFSSRSYNKKRNR